MQRLFEDRRAAGRQIGRLLRKQYLRAKDTIVLALPRGGVPIADEVARALELPLELWIVRKLGAPGHAELAMGAIAVGGVVVLNPEVIESLSAGEADIERACRAEKRELQRRNDIYRGGRIAPDVRGKTVIVTDDGLATGASMRAAIDSLRAAGASRVVVAVPVGAAEACAGISAVADDVVCMHAPEPFWGVGQWYEDFSQVGDEEVLDIMAGHRARGAVTGASFDQNQQGGSAKTL